MSCRKIESLGGKPEKVRAELSKFLLTEYELVS